MVSVSAHAVYLHTLTVVRPSLVDNLFAYSALIEGGCVGSKTSLLGGKSFVLTYHPPTTLWRC